MFQGMEYIYEVYKEKSFSKAAAALFISQPSLSANVKRVENRIGYPIFDRSTFLSWKPPLYHSLSYHPPRSSQKADGRRLPI